ncbi:MAG: AMP-binding protein [Pseudomonadota bacterium]
MSDLLAAFAAAAAHHPDRVALVEPNGTAVTYADLRSRIDGLAAAWSDLGPGARVLIALPLGADLYAALAALWARGATAILPEPATGLPGLRAALDAVPVDAMVTAGPYRLLRLVPALWHVRRLPLRAAAKAPAHPAQFTDPALISFTSGTTGAPKAIPRDHGFLAAQRAAIAPLLASDRPEIDLVAFPVFVLLNLAEGRSSVLPDWPLSRADRVPPDRLAALIQRHRVTRLLLPPALCETLSKTRIPDSAHTIFTGGGPVFPDLVAKLQSRLRVVSVYGSTEAEPIAHLDSTGVADADRHAMETGAGLLAGPPAAGTRIRILEGEIQVAGPHVVPGYLDPTQDATTKVREGGTIWHRTGDAGRLDDQGRLWLLGRTGAVVRTQAGPLYPFAVETAARLWPGTHRAALAPGPVLAIEGDRAHLPTWRTNAAKFGIDQVRTIDKMPMDRRHRSKIDLGRLAQMLR